MALSGGTRTIDVGRVSYRTWDGADAERYVANIGSVGMSAAVAQRANGMSKALGGKATFFYALVRVFLEWQNTMVHVELEGGDQREARMHDVIVANGRWHGGAMMLAPRARPRRRVVRRRADRRHQQARLRHHRTEDLQGHVSRAPEGRPVRAKAVTVDAPERLPIELDGEQVGTTPARFEIVPARCASVSRVSGVARRSPLAAYAALAVLVATGATNGLDQCRSTT